MSDITLSLAISYYDHVSDLVRGRVRPEGLSLTVNELAVEEIFFRMLAFEEWDVSELSMAKYVSLVGAGSSRFRAIPVFPSRVFRVSAVYVATSQGISGPQSLAGRRVGIPEWAQTAGVYARGYLQHQCGVRLEDILWVQGGVNEPGRQEKVPLALPDGIRIEAVPGRSLNEMLLAGDLDAIIAAREPDAFRARDPRVALLWPDYQPLEEAYYRETGVFPIMHVIVLRSSTFERHPWAAMNLYKAFEEAKRNSLRRFGSPVLSRVPMPWAYPAFAHAQQIFGEDPWPYGVERNRQTLEWFTRYCAEQGVSQRRVNVDELFPPNVTPSFKV